MASRSVIFLFPVHLRLHRHQTARRPRQRISRLHNMWDPLNQHYIIEKTVLPISNPISRRFHSEKKDPQVIVNDVLDLIKSRAKSGSNRNSNQEGYIYILQDPSFPEYVKIGQTTQCPTQRKKQIATCSKLTVDFVGSERLIKTAYYDRLEQIIHADLYNERCFFECACSTKRTHVGAHETDNYTKHGEWFKIDAKEAAHRVEMWRNWMRHAQPYKKPGSAGAGELKLDLRRRADYCSKESISEKPEERWTTFMAPFYMDEVDQNTYNWLS